MKVPFVPYKREYTAIGKEIISAINRCAKNGDFIYRKDVVDFERNLAKFTHTKYAISTDSCTGAMFLALKAAGIGSGDEVITVGHTYIATIDVIKHAGATPVLVDITSDFNIDVELIEKSITKKTRAIFVVHLNGRMCKMDKIMKIVRKNKLLLFEDAAQALNASYKFKPAGSWGLAGCFSFYPAKILGSYGEGGAVVTNNKRLADKLYVLRDHGEEPSYRNSTGKKAIKLFGYNSILDNIHAAVLNVKLKYILEWIEKRHHIYRAYTAYLNNISEVIPPPLPLFPHQDVFQNYVIFVQERDKLKKYLAKKGIETLVSWQISNHRQPALKELHKFVLPVTRAVSHHALSLPIHPWLTDKEVKYVANCIKRFYASDVQQRSP